MVKAVVIDDEHDSRKALINILRACCSFVVVVAEAGGVEQGIRAIREHRPDVVFLDIQMDDGSGFDLLERIEERNFQVIFVTGYDQFAIKAIRFSALDYLLKPIDPQALADAVNRVKKKDENLDTISRQIETLLSNKNGFKKISVPTLEGLKFIRLEEIIRCESDSNYTRFFLKSGEKILVTRTLKEFEEALSGMSFLRVHQSHMINLQYVDRYIRGEGGVIVMSDGSEVEVSRRKKEAFLKAIT